MIIYIITFIMTILCCKMAQYKNKYIRGLFLVLTALIPTILAGVRASTIGTDVETYVLPQLDLAKGQSFFEYMASCNIEIGYAILIYFSSIISSDYHIALFFTQLIMSILVVKIAYSQRKKVSMCLTMIVYLLTIYNYTLNIMRQGISILLIIYSLLMFNDKKYTKSIVLFIVAELFHNSTILCIPAYYILMIINSTKISESSKKIRISLIVITLLFLCLIFEPVTLFLVNHGIIPYRYYAYIDIYTIDHTNIGIFESIFKLIIIMLLYYSNKVRNNKLTYFSLIILICDFALFSLSSKVTILYRISYSYSMAGMLIGVPYIIKAFKQDKANILISNIGIISLLLLYWYRMFIQIGFCQTYPYVSDIVKLFNL